MSRRLQLAALTGVVAAVAAAAMIPGAMASSPRVLRVGSWHGIAGTYHSVQAAVDAARAGDWVLIGPGDWKEHGDTTTHKPASGEAGWGVTVEKTDLHLRGMNRNSVVIDGTKTAASQCSAVPTDQNFGGSAGRSGIVVYKVNGVTIDNLTVCNFLGEGNQIWWNGGDGSGHVGMGAYSGSYLTATSTYFKSGGKNGEYGIFVSNAKGPGLITRTYASNMADSSYYIGACPNCNAVLDRPWAEHSALGYSGTNSGGHLIIQNGQWDDNQSGIVSNSQNNDDAPSPQDGTCPSGTGSCEIWRNNYVHDNNDPNVPQDSGVASAGPVGTGMVIAGGRFDTVIDNRIAHNNAWGVLTVPYPDTEVPPSGIGQDCNGGFAHAGLSQLGGTGFVPCYFSDWGNEIAHNTFTANGSYGNPTNGDIADLSMPPLEDPAAPGNCWHDNTDTGGSVSSWPTTLQTTQSTCGLPVYPDPASTAVLTVQVVCDTGFFQTVSSSFPSCSLPAAVNYPQSTHITTKPLPAHLQTMPDPCTGVPANPWCASSGSSTGSRAANGSGLAATGLPVALPVGAAVAIGVALLLLRRRRRV